LRPAPMRLPPRCLVWFIVGKIIFANYDFAFFAAKARSMLAILSVVSCDTEATP
jgi:hypothetical protein